MNAIYLDSSSGGAAALPKSRRTPEGVLIALRNDPRVSTFDLSELRWLRGCIADLTATGRIEEDKTEPYPWHRYVVKEQSR